MKQIVGEKICPFVKEPREGCHCLKAESRYAEAIMKICGGDYEECEIYKDQKRKATDKSES